MKQVTVNIPEQKLEFFKALVQQLGFEITNNSIPQEHMDIVEERMRNSDPNKLLTWDEAQVLNKRT